MGMDQRKVNVLARDYCDITKRNKPVILSHSMYSPDFLSDSLYLCCIYCLQIDFGVIFRHVTWSTTRARQDVKN
jgi:hypothetical protein